MPFKSDKQRKWMFANEPDMAKRWSKHENMDEMPHFDSENGAIDLQIEKYPMPADEKSRLMRAFEKYGLVGELHGELLHFKPDHTVDVADEGSVARLPKLPADWLRYMKMVEN